MFREQESKIPPNRQKLTPRSFTVETIAFGKPQIGTFEFATRLLQQWRKDEYHINAPPETVYFVGDTPESDIRGTNLFNEKSKNEWYSILVRTGVYQEGTEPAYKPRITVDNVLDAVNHGIRREFTKKLKKSSGAFPFNTATMKQLSLDDDMFGPSKRAAMHSPIMEVSEGNTPEAV